MKHLLTTLVVFYCLGIQAQNPKDKFNFKHNISNTKLKCSRSISHKSIHKNYKKSRISMYLLNDTTFEKVNGNYIFNGSEQFTYSGTRASYMFFDNIVDFYNGNYIFDLVDVKADYDEYQLNYVTGQGKVLKTYNATNQILKEIKLIFNTTTLLYDTIYVTNNSYSNSLLTTSTQFGYINGIPDNEYKTTYYYDVNNNLITDTTLYKPILAGLYEYSSCEQFQYNGNNMTESLYQIWNNNAWENLIKEIYTYNVGNKVSSYNQAEWNGTSWDILTPFYITYNANQTIDSINYVGVSNLIEGILKYEYQIGNLLPSKLDIHMLNDTTNLIEYVGKIDFTYNSDNFLTKKQIKEYVSPNTFIDQEYKIYYYQNGPSNLMDTDNKIKLSIFPNPATENTYISYSTDDAFETRIIVTDILGNVKQSIVEPSYKGDHLVQIPLNNFSIGVYLIQLQIGNQIINSKIIKE